MAAKVAAKAVPAPVTVQATTSVPASAPITLPTTALPFTGADVDALRILLAGSLLAMLGMLVQIAGTPLPARARARR